MKTFQIYDPPMCCSTGVCGPAVNPVLPQFAADLDSLKAAGHQVDRFNLAQQPQAFLQNAAIHARISTQGTDCLPVIVVDGRVVSEGTYPDRKALLAWANAPANATLSAAERDRVLGTQNSSPAVSGLNVLSDSGACSGESGCC